MPNVVVLGAGVSGLTTAYLLSKDPANNVTIIAKHMPGDYDIEYASPWAGADFVPPTPSMGVDVEHPLELETWADLERLARDVPEAGIHFQQALYYRRRKDVGTKKGGYIDALLKEDNPFRKMMPNFRTLEITELPDGMDAGVSFTTACINTALYLPWLTSQCLKTGVIVRRGVVSHIADAASLHSSGRHAEIVFNCTGLSSLHLGGVEDKALFPTRGQIVLVRNDPGFIYGTTGTDDSPDESLYIMNRAGGGGCILGGCSLKNIWESQHDPNMAVRILRRAVETCPALVPSGNGIEGLDIVRHAVGLRPTRTGGIRIEREDVEHDGHSVAVVHNYGHGGAGYQTSYGAARRAIALLEGTKSVASKL